MSKIICLCGFSSSGKDLIAKELSNRHNFKPIVSTTSRPIRKTENNGVDYYFITKEQFQVLIASNSLIEYRTYNTLVNSIPDTWYYGVTKGSVDLSKNEYVVVLDIEGLRGFKKEFGDNVISFFINVDYETRKARCMGRGDYDECEFERRAKDDTEKFTWEIIRDEIDYVVKNDSFAYCIDEIEDILDEIRDREEVKEQIELYNKEILYGKS